MAGVHELSRTDARRIAVRAQLLTSPRPTDLVETVRRLSLLQLEPTSAIAPSAELVLWSRLGSASRPQELWDAVDEQRLIELRGTLRVAEDIALLPRRDGRVARHRRAARRGRRRPRDWVRGQQRLPARHPRPAARRRAAADAASCPTPACVPWSSSGWNNNRNVTMMLDMPRAARRGRRRRRERPRPAVGPRLPDLPRRPGAPGRTRRGGCATSAGSARSASPGPRAPKLPGRAARRRRGRRARGRRRGPRRSGGSTRPSSASPSRGRAALLSPFDRLLADRKRMSEVFEFDYILEMYKPAAQRRWGYYALPILYGDRLVGKLDARADREAGVLRVAAVHRGRAVQQGHDGRGRPRDRATWPAGSTWSSSPVPRVGA